MKIWTIPHTLFAAKNLVLELNKFGIPSQLVEEIADDDEIYIIYGALNAPKIPKNYIVYQTEIAGTHFFNERYLAIIKNAIAVFEYAEQNLSAYKHDNVIYLAPGVYPQPAVEKDIPLLFYGWIDGSERRKTILDIILKEYDVKIVTNITGQAMWDILSRTKVVLNIHYYDNSPLELFRISEAVSHNCRVISEISENVSMFENDYYCIAQGAISRIEKYIERPFANYPERKFIEQNIMFEKSIGRLTHILQASTLVL